MADEVRDRTIRMHHGQALYLRCQCGHEVYGGEIIIREADDVWIRLRCDCGLQWRLGLAIQPAMRLFAWQEGGATAEDAGGPEGAPLAGRCEDEGRAR